MGRPRRNPDDRSPGRWTTEETEQIKLYGVHIEWLQDRLRRVSDQIEADGSFSGEISIPELRTSLMRLGNVDRYARHIETIFALLALRRGDMTQREVAALLGLSVSPINRASQAFDDPRDFEPRTLTAGLRLNDSELTLLLATKLGCYPIYLNESWEDMVGEENFELWYELSRREKIEESRDPDVRVHRFVGFAKPVAEALRTLGWIAAFDDTTSTIEWQLIPDSSIEAIDAIHRVTGVEEHPESE